MKNKPLSLFKAAKDFLNGLITLLTFIVSVFLFKMVPIKNTISIKKHTAPKISKNVTSFTDQGGITHVLDTTNNKMYSLSDLLSNQARNIKSVHLWFIAIVTCLIILLLARAYFVYKISELEDYKN